MSRQQLETMKNSKPAASSKILVYDLFHILFVIKF